MKASKTSFQQLKTSLPKNGINISTFNCLMHSCQPFRFWWNSSAFYTIFRHSIRNDQIPPKLKKFGNANTMDKGYASARRFIPPNIFQGFVSSCCCPLTPIFSSSAACNGACDWQACGSWPMSSLTCIEQEGGLWNQMIKFALNTYGLSAHGS